MKDREYDNYDRDQLKNSLIYNDGFTNEESDNFCDDWERDQEKK